MAGPLTGIRVVELGIWVAAPAAAGVLADWGAEVVKVEAPDGDPQRGFSPTLAGTTINPTFEMNNRGKRGIALDLRSEPGHAAMLRLLDTADVFVTNLRIPALERLGMDHPTLAARDPALIYALLTGFGLGGDDRDLPGYDIGPFWSRAGIAHQLTQPGATPPFERSAMGDRPAGMSLAGGVCAALFDRTRTGRGGLVSTSLLRQGTYTMATDLTSQLRTGTTMPIWTRDTMPNPLVNPYRSADGKWFWLLGLESDRHWPALRAATGDAHLTDERFGTAQSRAAHCAELTGLLDEIFGRRPRDDWFAAFHREGVWYSAVQSIEEVLADPQVRAAGSLVESDGTTVVTSPVDFAGDVAVSGPHPPGLGEHTEAILRELGYTDAEITALQSARRERMAGWPGDDRRRL